MQFLFARAYAEHFGFELQTDPWVGERIFQIDGVRPHNSDKLPRYNEAELVTTVPIGPFVFRGYAQCQSAMLYTKREAQHWLTFRPEIVAACKEAIDLDNRVTKSDHTVESRPDTVVCHRRQGDFIGYGYPVVSVDSYKTACAKFGLDWGNSVHIGEEDPTPIPALPDELSFVADFYRLVTAPTLLRANSSFSWVTALLSDGLVLAPVIDGLQGGKVHDCAFVSGNHPRLANFDFTTDLRVLP